MVMLGLPISTYVDNIKVSEIRVACTDGIISLALTLMNSEDCLIQDGTKH